MLDRVLLNLKTNENYSGQIVKAFYLPNEPYEKLPLPDFLSFELKEKLIKNGISYLYRHQIESFNLLQEGYNVVITSSTASGKTLAFNVPILDTLFKNKNSTALYLYPTKALAHDQLEKLEKLVDFTIGTYDGDATRDEKAVLRRKSRIIFANPDILHVGLLPNHIQWDRFLTNLKFVVVDEAHYYSGVLGSHFAMIMRRLRRVLSNYGSFPQFVISSATLEDPEEFSFRLIGERFKLVDGPKNPQTKKLFVIFNPKLINEELNIRKSIIKEAVWVTKALLESGNHVIVFEKSRKGVELLYKYLKDEVNNEYTISPYRAGYSKEKRREIERGVKKGEIECIIATNALELGIDIGELDATVIVGYPGKLSSLFQQSNRSGRNKDSVTIFITSSNPLDQYFTKDPGYLVSKNFESININLDNPYILKPHLLCAAYEVPIKENFDLDYFGNSLQTYLKELSDSGELVKRNDKYFANSKYSIANKVNIRSVGEENIRLIDIDTNKEIEKMSLQRALEEVFPNAVYMHMGETYVSKKMDIENRVVFLQKEKVDYYTDSLAIENIWVRKTLKHKKEMDLDIYFGEVVVNEIIRGFVMKEFFTDKKIGTEPLELPSVDFVTKAVWFIIPDEIVNEVKLVDDLLGSIHAMEHSLVSMMPLIVQCDRNDVGGVSHPKHPDTDATTIFLYDGIEGGIGIAEKAYDKIVDLLNASYKSVSSCPCKDGCPSCIFSPKCGNENKPLSKSGAILLLRKILK